MTAYETAKKIAAAGMQRQRVYNFFDRVDRDVIDYVALFAQFGVDQRVVWDLFEDWQDSEN